MRQRSRYQGIELIVPAGTTGVQVNFPDIPELRSDQEKDVCIYSLAISSVESVPLTYSGNTNATLAQIQNGFLTLYVTGVEQIYRLELQRLLNIRQDAADYFFMGELFEISPIRVDWTKSYVSFGTPPANDDQFSYMFTFGYEWLPNGSYTSYINKMNAVWASGMLVTGK